MIRFSPRKWDHITTCAPCLNRGRLGMIRSGAQREGIDEGRRGGWGYPVEEDEGRGVRRDRRSCEVSAAGGERKQRGRSGGRSAGNGNGKVICKEIGTNPLCGESDVPGNLHGRKVLLGIGAVACSLLFHFSSLILRGRYDPGDNP